MFSAGIVAALSGCGPVKNAAGDAHHPKVGTGGHASASAHASSTTTHSAGTPGDRHLPGGLRNTYSFTTLDNPADLTFNQLLGINSHDVIAGYFGSGAVGHPNKGYQLIRTPAGFAIVNENFPGSAQTQVTGLNDRGVTVGFWSDTNTGTDANFGFYDLGGRFHSVNFPSRSNSTPPVNQLLGVNNQDVAVGFFNDANGNSHGYTYSIFGGRFRIVTIPGATSLTATAINNRDDVAGFFTNAAGVTDAFLKTDGSRVFTLAFPGASATQALGVNDSREVVGVYTVGSGSSAVMHGFTWTPGGGFKTVDDPQGIGTTTVNGVNDQGDLVGFYTDSAGNTDGFAAAPFGQRPFPGLIATATPSPSASASSSATPTMSPTATAQPTPSMSPTTSPSPSTTPSASSSPTPTPSDSTIWGTHF